MLVLRSPTSDLFRSCPQPRVRHHWLPSFHRSSHPSPKPLEVSFAFSNHVLGFTYYRPGAQKWKSRIRFRISRISLIQEWDMLSDSTNTAHSSGCQSAGKGILSWPSLLGPAVRSVFTTSACQSGRQTRDSTRKRISKRFIKEI